MRLIMHWMVQQSSLHLSGKNALVFLFHIPWYKGHHYMKHHWDL